MNNKTEEMKLVEGSRYRIISLGGRDSSLETEGIFRGFASIGIDEGGLILELGDNHGDMRGKLRIVPLHSILAIDILDIIEEHEQVEDKEPSHYYG